MRLHEQVEVLKDNISIYEAWIADLYRHMSTSKFHNDSYINTSDIYTRIDELKSSLR